MYIDLVINRDNIPLHLKAIDDTFIFNTMSRGMWHDEIEFVPNPLIVNTSFIIDIFINKNEGFNVNISLWKFICLTKHFVSDFF